MFGRGAANDFADEPTWRERLAERRANPIWVPQRPEWLGEGLATLGLLFVGIAAAFLTMVYLVVPPQTLPEAMPGYFSVAKAEAAARRVPVVETTTTTTMPMAERYAIRAEVQSWTPEKQEQFWAWIAAVGDYEQKEAEAEQLLRTPRTPPTRAWPYVVVFGAGAAGMLFAAWWVSDARTRRLAT